MPKDPLLVLMRRLRVHREEYEWVFLTLPALLAVMSAVKPVAGTYSTLAP